ncbi:MAG: hypothetical protein C0467_09220 [Planctomycetaceae bacterium]|nr:hypothetical protein [Planctomycetaceae bacterium]
MNSVLRQLRQWRLREQAITLAWGGARWFAILAVVLAFACALDWTIDRYSGSASWRKALRATRVLAPSDPLAIGHTPFGVRFLMTAGQLALAGALGYYFILRPWKRTPPIDDLAVRAEKAYPEFDHRLVTAIQLNRPTADTRGMSPALIADVTREAGEIASKHNLLTLINYNHLKWALVALLPVLMLWGTFAAVNAPLAVILVKRQALLKVEIPRDIKLENRTPEVYPTGAEVTVRYAVSGTYSPDSVGTLVVVPEGQPAEFYELTNEKNADGAGTEFFSVKLPPSSLDFSFQARLEAGRTEEASKVRFEAPPQLAKDDPNRPPLTAEQVLPAYLGSQPDGQPFYRRNDGWTRGEVVDALPRSTIIVEALFNKPVSQAQLVPIVREGLQERELPPISPAEMGKDKQSASFVVPTAARMIGYRIDLKDSYGFPNPTPIRRNVRMWEDRPPNVEFKPESLRNPNPEAFDGQGNPKDYEFDMALAPDGVVMVIFNARSEVGLRAANIRFRVIPKGVQFDLYPEEYKAIQHPRDDPNLIVYDRLPLTRFNLPKNADLGPFVSDLGLFTDSFTRTVELFSFSFLVDVVPRMNRNRVNVQFYPFPSRNPREDPSDLEAGGRYNFEISGLEKKLPEVLPDGKTILKRAKLEVGDTVEVYVEVFDKLPVVDAKGKPILGEDGRPLPPRPAGYTREAKRKIVVTEADAGLALLARDEARTKLRDKVDQLAKDQFEVFKPKKK